MTPTTTIRAVIGRPTKREPAAPEESRGGPIKSDAGSGCVLAFDVLEPAAAVAITLRAKRVLLPPMLRFPLPRLPMLRSRGFALSLLLLPSSPVTSGQAL
jgi:hypothetical protein